MGVTVGGVLDDVQRPAVTAAGDLRAELEPLTDFKLITACAA